MRFIGVGFYSLNVELVAYVTTSDYDEFLALQQELLLKLLQAVERAGTALAVPLQESFATYSATIEAFHRTQLNQGNRAVGSTFRARRAPS